jgi:hypothetical protein
VDFGELAALTIALEYDIKHSDNDFSLYDFYKELFDVDDGRDGGEAE